MIQSLLGLVVVRLPIEIESFLRAVRMQDHASLFARLCEEAVLTDGQLSYKGDEIRAWLDNLDQAGAHTLRAVHKLGNREQLVLTTVSAEKDGQGNDGQEVRKTWTFTFKDEQIRTVAIERAPVPSLAPAVAAYVRATNRSDLDGLVATFHPDAIVNDQLREYRGRDAIREWAARDIVGAQLTVYVLDVEERKGHVVVTANVDGNFDKRGLPDPLVLTHYFSVGRGDILQLIILHNLPAT